MKNSARGSVAGSFFLAALRESGDDSSRRQPMK